MTNYLLTNKNMIAPIIIKYTMVLLHTAVREDPSKYTGYNVQGRPTLDTYYFCLIFFYALKFLFEHYLFWLLLYINPSVL